VSLSESLDMYTYSGQTTARRVCLHTVSHVTSVQKGSSCMKKGKIRLIAPRMMSVNLMS